MACGQCGLRKRELFDDSTDGGQYCETCWTKFYGAAPTKGGGPGAGGRKGGSRDAPTTIQPAAAAGSLATGQTKPEGGTGFVVMASKKGGIPVGVEKRAKGKKVTVVSNIQGDCAALLTVLKRSLGSGGSQGPGPGQIELQGWGQKRP